MGARPSEAAADSFLEKRVFDFAGVVGRGLYRKERNHGFSTGFIRV